MYILKALVIIAVGTWHVAAQTPIPTPTETFTRPSLTMPSCWQLAESLPAISATPPPDIPVAMSELAVSFALGSLYNTQDPCELPVVTGTLVDEFSDWASAWTSWQWEQTSNYRVIWSSCSDDPQITDIIPVGPGVCSNLVAEITGTSASEKDDKDDKENSEDKGNDEPEVVDDSSGSRAAGSLISVAISFGALVAVFY